MEFADLGFHILAPDGTVRPARDAQELAEFRAAWGHRLRCTILSNGTGISSVFLNTNHGFVEQPVWFEMGVFANFDTSLEELDMQRFTSFDELARAHEQTIPYYCVDGVTVSHEAVPIWLPQAPSPPDALSGRKIRLRSKPSA